MEKFIIDGGYPLSGEITPSGNKHPPLPILAACILTEEPEILLNITDIRDVKTMRSLLMSLGIRIEEIGDHTWEIQASEVHPGDLDPDICCQIRASILLAGPMIARAGELQ